MLHGDRSESLRARPRKRVAYRSNDAPVLGKESYIALEPGSNSSQRVLLDGGWRLSWRQYILDQPPDRVARLLRGAAGETPHHRGRETKEDEAGEQGEVEAQVKAQH